MISVLFEHTNIGNLELKNRFVRSGTMDRIAVKGITSESREGYFLYYAQALKKKVTIPVMLVGGLRTPEVMARVVSSDGADLLSMSRPLIREPYLVRRWKNGKQDKAACISCNQCFENWMFRPLRCYVDEPLNETEKRQTH